MREQPPLRAEGWATTMPSTSARSNAMTAAALRSDTREQSDHAALLGPLAGTV
jgi:hypothetical protein